jgi:hypothetical protein
MNIQGDDVAKEMARLCSDILQITRANTILKEGSDLGRTRSTQLKGSMNRLAETRRRRL